MHCAVDGMVREKVKLRVEQVRKCTSSVIRLLAIPSRTQDADDGGLSGLVQHQISCLSYDKDGKDPVRINWIGTADKNLSPGCPPSHYLVSQHESVHVSTDHA